MRRYQPKGKRKIEIVGEVAYVPLTRGFVATIDAADVRLIEGRNWQARVRQREEGEPYVSAECDSKTLQAAILGEREAHRVTHLDGDGLNNRRSNLVFRSCVDRSGDYELDDDDAPKAIPADRAITINDGIARVPLTQGHFATIDVVDLPLVEGHMWRAQTKTLGGRSEWSSAARSERVDAVRFDRKKVYDPKRRSWKRRLVFLRHEIAKQLDWWEEGMGVTFVNGNRLDLRRANLKPSEKRTDTNCGVPGVWQRVLSKKFTARVSHNGKAAVLGHFDTLTEAREALDEYYGRYPQRRRG